MSLASCPASAVAKVRGPVASCVQRCLASSARAPASSSASARAPPPASIGRLGVHDRAARSFAPRAPRSPHPSSSSSRSFRASAIADAAAADSAATESGDPLRLVQERLGVTLGEEATVPPPPPLVLVVSGSSGVGKDAVVRRLLELRPELGMVVTATDRAMRPGEVDGRDYHFVSTAEFERMARDGELVEHAVVYGQHKGIPKRSVRDRVDAGLDVVLRLDVQGAATVRRMIPEAVHVFLAAESEGALARRLAARGTETVAELAERVETARAETARIDEFDYVVVNAEGKLEDAAERVAAVVDAEKCRRGREAPKLA